MKTVLIVDDERDAVDVLSLMLEMSGFAVMVAYDGTQAIACLEQRRPDLILSDFMMPGMDGVALCRRLKGDRATADIPFILMTAAVNVPTDAPIDRMITKPVELAKLLDTFTAVSRQTNHSPVRVVR
ncbi:response regulator [uncultured Oxalicibacterium sp.]|uniref:response regulator n=1 Tax=uncultured Oxalicibacterium sp. TaxID=1168540 RepID=UPI0025E45CF3|nr:response regulator [uncultured Oxalicibacterium sp.]